MSDTEGFIIKWESAPWGDVEFDGEIFEKNRRMRRGWIAPTPSADTHTLWETEKPCGIRSFIGWSESERRSDFGYLNLFQIFFYLDIFLFEHSFK